MSVETLERVHLKPNSKPQSQFLRNAPLNDETVYGGAAGPGKTWSAVVLPLYHGMLDVSTFRGQIFRETSLELQESVLPECNKYYPLTGGRYNDQKKIWTFPSGARIRLCYMEHDGDWKRYSGGNNTYQAFDEAGNMHPSNLETIVTWNRSSPDCPIKSFRVYLTNPGGRSHRLLKKGFVDVCPPIKDGQMRYSSLAGMWWQPMKGSEPFYFEKEILGKKIRLRRQFIPARVFDNEDLLRTNPNYLATLLNLPVEKRKMLLEGDWDYIQGQFFSTYSHEIHLWKPAFDPPKSWGRIAGMDYGNVTCAEFIAEDAKRDIWVYREWTQENKSKTYKAIRYKRYLEDIGESGITTVGDVNMFAEYSELPEERASAHSFIERKIKLVQVSKKSPDNRRFRVWINDELKDLMDWEKKNGMFVKKPKIHIMAERCPNLIETLPLLETDPNLPEDYQKEQDKTIAHWVKALQYALISRNKRYTQIDVEKEVAKMKARAAGKIT